MTGHTSLCRGWGAPSFKLAGQNKRRNATNRLYTSVSPLQPPTVYGQAIAKSHAPLSSQARFELKALLVAKPRRVHGLHLLKEQLASVRQANVGDPLCAAAKLAPVRPAEKTTFS